MRLRCARFIANSLSNGVLLAILGATQPAVAQDLRITLSPRFWYLVDNFTTGNLKAGGGVNFLETTQRGWAVPMFGASASLLHPAFPRTSFTLSALYGTASNVGRLAGGAVTENSLRYVTANVPQDLTRADFELTAQTSFGQNLAWTTGIRLEHVRIDYEPAFTVTEAVGASAPATSRVVIPFKDGYNLYSARGGIVGALPMGESGAHRLYTQVQGFIGYRDPVVDTPNRFDSAWFMGPDITVGYQYALSERVVFDFRYRVLAFFPITGASSFSDARTTHGPIISANFTF